MKQARRKERMILKKGNFHGDSIYKKTDESIYSLDGAEGNQQKHMPEPEGVNVDGLGSWL